MQLLCEPRPDQTANATASLRRIADSASVREMESEGKKDDKEGALSTYCQIGKAKVAVVTIRSEIALCKDYLAASIVHAQCLH